uniref:Hydin adenylate kinase-like domain-containing protein n=1 Tax=Stegastes partitus TaxID=144197 RepID=A0A3B5AYQ7_9TELE
MYWRNAGFPSSTKTRKGDSSPSRTFLPPIPTARQGGSSLISSSREKPLFSLSPSRVELFPGGSVDMVLTGSSDSPVVVRERLVCQGIIGAQGSNEHIMSVDIICRFVAPVLSISSKELNFYIKKDKGKRLLPVYEKLVLKNVSSLSRSVELSLVEPFSLCEDPGDHISATTKVHSARSQAELWICFNPAFYPDRVSRTVDEFLEVHYPGHQQEDMVSLHAEVHHPNLSFSSTTVDFGCVFNCTGTRKVITITNCSPLPVSYHWGFLDDQKHSNIRYVYTEHIYILSKQNIYHFSDGSIGIRIDHLCCPVYYGQLQPGDQQQVTLFFYGHKNASREVVAQCHVEEGPSYEVKLRGEASLSDCYRGIVIAGLESAYTQSAASTLKVVLKALNNRKHIYAVNLSDSYAALKARERAQREAERKLQEFYSAVRNQQRKRSAESVMVLEDLKQSLIYARRGSLNHLHE